MNQRGKITLLLFVFSICATAVLVRYWVRTGSSASLSPTELFDAVESQLEAVRSRDFARAYNQSSSSFQQHWTLEQFSGMARARNLRLRDARQVEFGPWERQGRRAIVQVFFVNGDGDVYPCLYLLVSEGDQWKVDGTRWVRGWPSGQRMRGIQS